ncbi:MAG: hypothetical protein AAFP70_14125 [Calditrichota bacterium]
MYKVVLNQIADVATWPIVALLIFATVFTAFAIHAVRLDKQEANRYAAIPLDEEFKPENTQNGGTGNGQE